MPQLKGTLIVECHWIQIELTREVISWRSSRLAKSSLFLDQIATTGNHYVGPKKMDFVFFSFSR